LGKKRGGVFFLLEKRWVPFVWGRGEYNKKKGV